MSAVNLENCVICSQGQATQPEALPVYKMPKGYLNDDLRVIGRNEGHHWQCGKTTKN